MSESAKKSPGIFAVTAPPVPGKEVRLAPPSPQEAVSAFAPPFLCRKFKILSLASVQVPYFSATKSSSFETTTGAA